MSYVDPIFTPGREYRAKKAFRSGPTSEFAAGEILVFVRDSYSPYDNCFVYVFRTKPGGVTKEWWRPEQTPAESWVEFFEPVT